MTSDLSAGAVIRRLRLLEREIEAAGVDFSAVLRAARLSHMTWKRWIKGESSPRVENINRLEIAARRARNAAQRRAGRRCRNASNTLPQEGNPSVSETTQQKCVGVN